MNNSGRKSTMTLEQIENQMVQCLKKSFEYTANAHEPAHVFDVDAFFEKVQRKLESYLDGYADVDKQIFKVRTLQKLSTTTNIAITFYEESNSSSATQSVLDSHYFKLGQEPMKKRRTRHRNPPEADHVFNQITHEIDTRMMELPESYDIATLKVEYTPHPDIAFGQPVSAKLHAYYTGLGYYYVLNDRIITVGCQ
jgi:hypothetical protein